MAKYSLRELLVRTGAPLSVPPTYQSQTASREPEACFSKGKKYLKIFKYFQLEKHATSQFAQVTHVVSMIPLGTY